MSLMYAEEDVAYATPAARANTRLAAGLGVAAAVLVMLVCLASFVVGGSQPARSGGAVGQFARNFSLRDLNENRVTLSQYRGRPVLLLVSEDPLAPELLERATGLGGAHVVINVHESDSAPGAAVNGTGKSVVHLLDHHRVVSEDYELTDLPAALVISPDGLILESGPLSETLARLSDD